MNKKHTKNIVIKNLMDVYIGTYYSENSKGIYHATFDAESGRMTEPKLFYEARNAKWICLTGRSMVFPIEREGLAGVCFLDSDGETANYMGEILEERQTPCYVLQSGRYVYTANYHEGNVMVYHIKEGKSSLVKRIENGHGAGCHQIILHEKYIMVPCLEQNKIRLFDTLNDYQPAGDINFPDHSGPRHGIFNKAHTQFYAVSEWSNELFIFQVNGKEFTLVQTLSVLPKDGYEEKSKPAAAAIRLSRDEKFLYVSVRGIDIITVFQLREETDKTAAIIQHFTCGGIHPRDFVLSQNEKYMLVANRFEGGIVSIERDRKSGLLLQIRDSVSMPEGVSLALKNNTEEVF